MASNLTERLSRLVKTMRGQARITEDNVQDMLREVRMALLEADVALPVVRDFIARVKEKALGQEVVASLTPGQVLVSIVQKELAATMGEGIADIDLALCMTVFPGFGGQAYIPESTQRIRELRGLVNRINPACEIEVDGGIDAATIGQAAAAGANVFVAGTAVYGWKDGPAAATRHLQELARAAQ